jgi:UDP-glucose 4-epimerase
MVGPRVVSRFADLGCAVRVLATELPSRPFPPEVEVVLGDVADPAAARSAVDGIDVVLHMAGLLHAVGGAVPSIDAYRRVNVAGTREMVEASLVAGVRRVVFFSTIAVYGPGRGEVWDEHSAVNPDTPYAVTKAEAEDLVLRARRRDDVPLGVVLRLGAVYGPNLKGNYRRLVTALARGWFVPIGPGANRRALIHDLDVAEGAVLAATHPRAAGRLYNLTDGEEHTMADIIGAVCVALGRRPPWLRLPIVPVRVAVGGLERAAHLVGARPPLSQASIDKYCEDARVDVSRIRGELGFVPKVGLSAGWSDAIAGLHGSGLQGK